MKLEQILAVVLLVSLMFGVGMHLRRDALVAALRDVGLLVRALIANFILVPIAGLVIVRGLHVEESIATGILLMAIAPGVPFVVMAGGSKKGGSDEFAIELAIVMQVLATFTIPFTVQLVLPAAEGATVPPSHLFGLLAFQFVPLVAGALLAAFSPAMAKRLERADGLLTLASLLALLVFLAVPLYKAITILLGTLGILAAISLTIVSLAIGWLLGWGRIDQRRTLAIGTVLRNPAIAAVIATTQFPGTHAIDAVLVYFLIQATVAAAGAGLLKRIPGD